MNLNEAYSILELPAGSSPADAKKKFRELSKKYHPDNKVTGDEAKFKKLNEAHQFITKPETRQHVPQPQPNINFHNFNFRQQQAKSVEEIKLDLYLTFAESILGCKKEIKYKRTIKCETCDGDGLTIVESSCDKCHGRGLTEIRRGNMVFVAPCDKCGGKRVVEPCKVCNRQGTVESETEISVNIPGGVSSSNVLRLQGKGNYFGNLGAFDQYLDAFVELKVEEDPDLKLVNKFVVYDLTLSLLEAINGCSKNIRTVKGTQTVDIGPLSRNKDEVLIPNAGINGKEPQKVILNVQYPKDVSLLINALNESK